MYYAATNAETHDRQDHPAADSDGHVVGGTVFYAERSTDDLTPVRAIVGHGVSPPMAAEMLRKIADLIEEAPEMLSEEPGATARRVEGDAPRRARIDSESVAEAAQAMPPEARDRFLKMFAKVRGAFEDRDGSGPSVEL